MTRFSVNGRYLDTATISLQYSKKNVHFAFEDTSCERTTEFKLPANGWNNSLLENAKDVHSVGNKMRIRIACEMQDGIVVKSGYIYIKEYNAHERTYSCVFVCGHLLPLLDLKGRGKLNEWFESEVGCLWDGQWHAGDSSLWKTYYYPTRYYAYATGQTVGWRIWQPYPSIGLGALCQAAIEQAGYTHLGIADSTMRFVPEYLYDSNGAMAVFGSIVKLEDNLPDMTAVDLVKMIANLNGWLPACDKSGVGYDKTDISQIDVRWRYMDISGKVIRVESVSRSVEGFGQLSSIVAKNTEQNSALEDYKRSYVVSNDNEKEEKTLYEVPIWSARYDEYNIPIAQATIPSGAARYTVMHVEQGDGVEDASGKYNEVKHQPYIGAALSAANPEMTHPLKDYNFPTTDHAPYIVLNSIVQQACTKSTRVVVSVRMTLWEFDNMKDSIVIYYDGAKWVWFAAEWGSGVAKLTLQKIS